MSAFWYNVSNIYTNGVMFTVKFKLVQGLIGANDLTLTYDPRDISSYDNAKKSLVMLPIEVQSPTANFGYPADVGVFDLTFSAVDKQVVAYLNHPVNDNAMLAISVYEKERLLSLKRENITKNGYIAINNLSIPTNADTIKATMWNTSLSPHCTAITFEKINNIWTQKQ